MRIVCFLCFALCFSKIYAQAIDREFPSEVIDSLQSLYEIKEQLFNQCKSNESYYSLSNTSATLLYNASARKESFSTSLDHLSKDSILVKFPETKVVSNVFVVKKNDLPSLDYHSYAALINGEWLTFKSAKGAQAPNFARSASHMIGRNGVHYFDCALYFDKEWNYQLIDPKFGDLITYSLCVVDAKTPVFLSNTKTISRQGKDEGFDLIGYIDSLAQFQYKDSLSRSDREKREDWIRHFAAEDLQLKNAYYSILEKGYHQFVHPTLEQLAFQFEDEEGLLAFHRNQAIRGSCSMDDRPIKQLEKIAHNAALLMDWDLFIKTHLDLINNRYLASAYSSYGVANRKNPANSLEIIFDPMDLFLGTILQYHQKSEKQYQSNRFQIAKSILALQEKEVLIEKLIEMSRHSGLDVYNRLCILDMLEYLHRLEPENLRESTLASIRAELPSNKQTLLE